MYKNNDKLLMLLNLTTGNNALHESPSEKYKRKRLTFENCAITFLNTR